jgi:GNAT superfamily N-acetyltransferase
MEFRLAPREWLRGRGEANRSAMRRLVESGRVPGILAYAEGEPVGWCSVAPREELPGLEHREALRRIDDTPVWSIVCFFVARTHRGQGLMRRLLRAAVAHARSEGARVLEAYPRTEAAPNPQDASGFRGLLSVLEAEGFVEVARRARDEPILRLTPW